MADAAAVDLQPTAERIRRILAADPERVSRPVTDQKRKQLAWRVTPVVDAILRDKHIGLDERDAYDRFASDWYVGFRSPAGVAKYGASASNGTPISQMLNDAMERAEFQEVKRFNAAKRAVEATRSIRREDCRRAVMMTLDAEQTLVAIGLACSAFRNHGQARAAAVTMLQVGLYDLHLHYDPGSTQQSP